ncbi:hypothetical protein PV336_16370 [Streptomyces sp. MI02-2A]|uniref:hypothetical protein n=1 Tax=Streptomyces sp. MI02-2A TaxID=3028688 RepID=UPI0029A74A20|nr:hypothetical protein [Streptomyces sp. MI02-2A]MDX3260797.1 hypothetical protein [Streptomyces sp. MI02-2A]
MTDHINLFEIVGEAPTMDDLLNTSGAESSKPIEITLDEAKTLLADAVKEKGADYVYQNVDSPHGNPTCAYFDPTTGAPSCIVGHVIAAKGATRERLDNREQNLYTDVQGLVHAEIIKVDNETHALLTIAQEKQDRDVSWGEAVKGALEGYEERAREYEGDVSEDYEW